MVTKEGVKPFPPTGYRTLNARTAFFYGVTGITPAMSMRLPGIGSQYLFALVDTDKNYFDGAKTYKVTLPKNIPEANFWSFTLYDNQTRSMLDTPQRYPRAGSQSYPSPAAEAAEDGSTTIWFAPEQPEGVKRGNWIQTDPKQRLVHDPAAVQSARTVLHQGMAAERDRESRGLAEHAAAIDDRVGWLRGVVRPLDSAGAGCVDRVAGNVAATVAAIFLARVFGAATLGLGTAALLARDQTEHRRRPRHCLWAHAL